MKEATFSRKNLCCNQMNKKGFVSNSISSLILYQKTDFTLYLPIVLKISKTLLQMVSRILMKGYSSIFINFTSFMGLLMFVSIDSKTEIVKHFTIEEKIINFFHILCQSRGVDKCVLHSGKEKIKSDFQNAISEFKRDLSKIKKPQDTKSKKTNFKEIILQNK